MADLVFAFSDPDPQFSAHSDHTTIAGTISALMRRNRETGNTQCGIDIQDGQVIASAPMATALPILLNAILFQAMDRLVSPF